MSDPLWLSRLLEKVLGAADLRAKAARTHVLSQVPFSRPFITIAREPGSGGAPIGQEVARRLGFEFYDQKLIDEITKSSKLRKDIVAKIDEKGRTVVQDFIQGILNPNYVSDVTFVRHMTHVIVTLAYQGRSVILGRGANFLTPRENGLHVRIVAPLSIRIDRAVRYEGVSVAEAKEIVREVGKDRRDFVKQYFGEDIRRPEHYDLTLNTEFYSVAEAADLIIDAFHKKTRSTPRSAK